MSNNIVMNPRRICGMNFYRAIISDLYKILDLGAEPEYSSTYLMNRERVGTPIRHKLEEIFITSIEPAVLIVDFKGVKEMTGSVAEEIGPKLFGAIENHRKVSPEKYIVYDNLCPEAHKELDAWFVKYGHCVPAFLHGSNGTGRIIGSLPPQNLQEVINYCYSHGLVTSSDLEQKIHAASKKLKDVQNLYPWLLRRHSRVTGESSKSWRYQFMPIIPLDRQGILSEAESGKIQ